MEKLHPGAKWIFRINAYGSFLVFAIFLIISSLRIQSLFNDIVLILIVIPLGIILVVLIGGEIYARLAYANWGYEFTDMGLKTERGIIWKKYSSVPYERVQNVDLQRGVIARILGFSSLQIQTAGATYTGKSGHAEGYIPALEPEHAEQIRESLMSHISSKGM